MSPLIDEASRVRIDRTDLNCSSEQSRVIRRGLFGLALEVAEVGFAWRRRGRGAELGVLVDVRSTCVAAVDRRADSPASFASTFSSDYAERVIARPFLDR